MYCVRSCPAFGISVCARMPCTISVRILRFAWVKLCEHRCAGAHMPKIVLAWLFKFGVHSTVCNFMCEICTKVFVPIKIYFADSFLCIHCPQANNCPICRAPFRALLQIRAMRKKHDSISQPPQVGILRNCTGILAFNLGFWKGQLFCFYLI